MKSGTGSHMPKWLEADLGDRWIRKGFLADVFVERQESKNVRDRPLLAAEIEAAPDHVIGLDATDRGYLWDFYKLVHVRAPKLLFVACTTKSRLEELSNAIVIAARATRSIRNPDDELAVILLPAGATEAQHVRMGVSRGQQELTMSCSFSA
jgi:hypothetical protein